jgi:hypothetical protein
VPLFGGRSSSRNRIRRPLQVRPDHAVLFPQECDHVALLAFQPPEQRRDEQVQRNHAAVCARTWSIQLWDTTHTAHGTCFL